MKPGQAGHVLEIQGGMEMINRLTALGIMPGKKITKINAMFLHGPITVTVNRTHVAIGFGMARRVILEVDVA